MKHNEEWLAKRIMESIKDAPENVQKDVCKIAGDKDLKDLEQQTLRRIFDMVVSSGVR